MKYLIITIIALITFSCSLEKRCAKMDAKCPRETITIIHDSIIYKEKIVIHDSIIEVKLPSDTITINKYVYVDPDNLAQMDTIIVNEGIIEAIAWVNDSKLGLTAYVKDSSLYYALDSARIVITRYTEKFNKITKKNNYTIYKDTPFGRFCKWWFWISIALVALLVILKIKRVI